MPTQVLAPTTSAGTSGDITVTSAAPVTVGLFSAGGGAIAANVVAPITRKNPSGTYNQTGEALSGAATNATITGAGVYRVEKPITDSAIGILTD